MDTNPLSGLSDTLSALSAQAGDRQAANAGPPGGGPENIRVVVCAPPEESRMFVALLPPGNPRGVEVSTFTDDCAVLEQDVGQIRPAVVLLSPNSRNYSPALINRLRRRPDFMVAVVGLVPPAGDWGAEMTGAGAVGFLTTPATEATVDRLVASLPDWMRRAAEERSSPSFLFGLTPAAMAAMAAQGYQRGTYTTWSPKGGAGKTTLACNLAVLLGVLCQRSTLLVDANMNGGHVWLHMGLRPKGTIYGLAQAFAGSANRMTPRDLASHVTPYGQTLDVLAGVTRVEQAGSGELCGQNGAQGMAFMTALLDLARRQYDFVVVDLGSTPNVAVHLAALQGADRVLLVVTPDRTALVDARNAVETLVTGLGFARSLFWLVINMFTEESGLTRREIPSWMELVEMGLIPLDPTGRLMRSANTGKPFVLEYLQERNPDADVEAVLEGFAGVATNIYPPLRVVWDDRRQRVRAARPRRPGLLDRILQPA